MAIEVVPAELYALAGVLDAAAGPAARVGASTEAAPVGGPLGGPVTAFGEVIGTVGRCLAGELGWLSRAVATAADSWRGLDGSLLAAAGRSVPE